MKQHESNQPDRGFIQDFISVGVCFLLWRALLYLIETIAPFLWPLRPNYIGLVTPWANFDGAHYTSIARDGYGAYQYAFFPVYPRLIGFVQQLTHAPYEMIAVGISHISFFTGLLLWWWYLEKAKNRLWTIALLLTYPASYYFAAAYSEGVFFALAAGTLLSLNKRWWWTAGSLAGLASATRLAGVFLWLPIVIGMWQNRRIVRTVDWLAAFLPPLGLIGYMGYLWKASGDPLAFFHVQAAFGAGRSGSGLIFIPQVLWRYAMIFTTVPWRDFLYHIAALEFVSFIFALLLLFTAWRKSYPPGILLYSACVLFLPTFTGTLSSMPRYILAAFPLFSVLGDLRSWRVKSLILIVFTALFVYATTAFLRGYFIS
jgi:hypothetical protein